mmetsp:Transcript_147477/g.268850  ORF Transcript_147477/g.268850 Transcript_147477/m.268850 type:complete len:240 (+) Transcript_147477:495-1214(+)
MPTGAQCIARGGLQDDKDTTRRKNSRLCRFIQPQDGISYGMDQAVDSHGQPLQERCDLASRRHWILGKGCHAEWSTGGANEQAVGVPFQWQYPVVCQSAEECLRRGHGAKNDTGVLCWPCKGDTGIAKGQSSAQHRRQQGAVCLDARFAQRRHPDHAVSAGGKGEGEQPEQGWLHSFTPGRGEKQCGSGEALAEGEGRHSLEVPQRKFGLRLCQARGACRYSQSTHGRTRAKEIGTGSA